MEITTTMVRFRFIKKAMEKRTNRAQLFLCGNIEQPAERVWEPLSKCEITEDDDPNYNVIMMPKWCYLKSALPYYSDAEEFVVTSEVTTEQLNSNYNS